MIRLFLAVPIPPVATARLQRLQDGVPGARWSSAENLHLTLRFVGEIAPRAADDLDLELSRIACAAFDMVLAGVGAFDTAGETRAIWVGVEASAPLTELQRRCEAAARRAGLKPETQAWRPHVTLAYLSGAPPAKVGAWVQHNNLVRVAPFEVASFGLYTSWRSREGSTYRLERSYALREPRRDP